MGVLADDVDVSPVVVEWTGVIVGDAHGLPVVDEYPVLDRVAADDAGVDPGP